MTKPSLASLVAICFSVLGFAEAGKAGLIIELESEGTSINNTIGTAQFIPESGFTIPAPATVFDLPGVRTATVQGSNGDTDVDFFRFSSIGGRIYLDMDNSPATFDPIVALFDSAGTLVAYGDDSALDNGSDNTIDSFLGVFNLPAPGIYYVGVSQNANFPTTGLTATETPLTRPDGGFGGYAVSGVSTGISTYDFSGPQASDTHYTLHISMQSEIPEPGSLGVSGAALLLLSLVIRRRRAASSPVSPIP